MMMTVALVLAAFYLLAGKELHAKAAAFLAGFRRHDEAQAVALEALALADWVVLGPGSLFTSVIPHLLVPDLREALVKTEARILLVLNLDEQAGETHGFGPEDHLAALAEHAPDLMVHTVLADRAMVGQSRAELEHVVAAYGATLVVDDLAEDDGSARHDPARLAAACARIFADGD